MGGDHGRHRLRRHRHGGDIVGPLGQQLADETVEAIVGQRRLDGIYALGLPKFAAQPFACRAQPGSNGVERHLQDPGGFVDRIARIQVQRDDRAVVGRESSERLTQDGQLGRLRRARGHLDPIGRVVSPWGEAVPTLCLADCLADHDAVKPRSDAVGVGLLALSPRTLERRLDGVLRLIDVPRHEACKADEAWVVLGHEGLERLHREARPTDPDLLRRR